MKNKKGEIGLKSTGIIRKVDSLGRVVIPKLIRQIYDSEDDLFEIFVEGNTIVLQKYEPTCTFCGMNHEVFQYGSYNICADCLNNIIHISKQ